MRACACAVSSPQGVLLLPPTFARARTHIEPAPHPHAQASSKNEEAGYVMRALQGKLRIGLAEQARRPLWVLACFPAASPPHAAAAVPACSCGCSPSCRACLHRLTTHRLTPRPQTVLVALAHAKRLQEGGLSGDDEEMAGELERAAQVVKQVRLAQSRVGRFALAPA